MEKLRGWADETTALVHVKSSIIDPALHIYMHVGAYMH